jgi:hypothetical protein
MSGTAFTKGPWLMAAKPSSVVGWPIVAPQAMGRVICSLNYADPKAFGGRQSGDIAFNRESKANAHLISAAPELYEALESLLIAAAMLDEPAGFDDDGDRVTLRAGMFHEARAVLAKARGQ